MVVFCHDAPEGWEIISITEPAEGIDLVFGAPAPIGVPTEFEHNPSIASSSRINGGTSGSRRLVRHSQRLLHWCPSPRCACAGCDTTTVRSSGGKLNSFCSKFGGILTKVSKCMFRRICRCICQIETFTCIRA